MLPTTTTFSLSWTFPAQAFYQESSFRLLSILDIDSNREHNFPRGSLSTGKPMTITWQNSSISNILTKINSN